MRKYFDTIIDKQTGIPVAGAFVSVTLGYGVPVQLYADDQGTPITDPINRVQTNSLGLYQFFVADGTYTLTFTYSNTTPVIVTDVEIYDLSDIDAAVVDSPATAEQSANERDSKLVRGAPYIRSMTTPVHTRRVQDASGAWYELATPLIDFATEWDVGVNDGNDYSVQLQQALTDAYVESVSGGRYGGVFIPPWRLHATGMFTPTAQTGYASGKGIVLKGARGKSILTQDATTAVIDYSSLASSLSGYVIKLHGSNHTLQDFSIDGAAGGIYLGEDATISGCEVSYNILRGLNLSNVGTAIDQCCGGNAAYGVKYNDIADLNIYQTQIAYLQRTVPGVITAGGGVNRHYVRGVKIHRANVGVWLQTGDTTTFTAVHAEGCAASVPSTSYGLPDNLPAAISSTGAAWIMETRADLNILYNCFCESNQFDLYHAGGRNEFHEGRFAYDTSSKVNFVTRPLRFLGEQLYLDNYTFRYTGSGTLSGALLNFVPGIEFEARPLLVGSAGSVLTTWNSISSIGVTHASSSSVANVGASQFSAGSRFASIGGSLSYTSTFGGVAAPPSGAILARFYGDGSDGTGTYVRGGYMDFYARGAFSTSNAYSGWRLRLCPNGSITPSDIIDAVDSNADMVLSPIGNLRLNKTFASSSTPASFSAAKIITIKDASGTTYYVPAATAVW